MNRVVLTSLIVAVTFGLDHRNHIFTVKDWSHLSAADRQVFVKSKSLAEKGAWDFVDLEGKGLELAVINPTGVLGPIIGPRASSSIGIVGSLLSDKMARRASDLMLGVVKVRDVVELHIRAMITPGARGERFLATNKVMTVLEIADIVKDHFPKYASQLPSRVMPSWLNWFAP